MKKTSVVLAIGAVSGLLAVSPASAIIISDNFSGYTASASTNLSVNPGGGGPYLGNATTGYVAAGGGWLIGWRNGISNASTSAYVLDTAPVVPSGGNYFSYTVNTVAGSSSTGSSLTRAYNATEVSSSGTESFSTSFDFRADSVSGGPVRFNLSNSNNRTAFYDSSATWVLSAYNGSWYVGDGPGANFVNTGMAFSTGVTYSFSIEENPVTKLWDVTIFDGVSSVTLSDLDYRTAAWSTGGGGITDARWLTFSATETAATSLGASATFSVDNVVITNVPEPSTFLLLGLTMLGGALARHRRNGRSAGLRGNLA